MQSEIRVSYDPVRGARGQTIGQRGGQGIRTIEERSIVAKSRPLKGRCECGLPNPVAAQPVLRRN
jgi:hypothetical protein